jgi:uncharacterized protein (DUF433 family)
MAISDQEEVPIDDRTAVRPAPREQALIDRWIVEDQYRPGIADARIRNHWQHVWALVGHAKATVFDPERVAFDYDIPAEAVQAAFAFYARHRQIIDDRLRANAAEAG